MCLLLVYTAVGAIGSAERRGFEFGQEEQSRVCDLLSFSLELLLLLAMAVSATIVGACIVPLEPSLAREHQSVISEQVGWCRNFSLKPRKFNALRLVAAANTQDSQNVDLPPMHPKRRKKPSLLPKQSRKKRIPAIFEDPSLKPPANGLLVKPLIPVAHEVMEAKAIATKGVRLLLEELPVLACR